MIKQILIISCKIDDQTSSVIKLLNERKIPFFRLNTESLLTDYEFAWTCNASSLPSFYIKDKNTGKIITGENIHSVWYRRPFDPRELPLTIDKEIDKHNLEEAKAFFSYLMFYLSDYYSIGNHLHDKYAKSKLIQHKLAIELGMQVPPTCFTNTKKDLVDFATKQNDVVLKAIYDYNIWYDEDNTFTFYTKKVASKDLIDVEEDSFCQTVNFSEKYIEKKYELRITVMGNRIFGCKIDSQIQEDDTGRIDWRQGYDNGLKHESIELPSFVEIFCKKYLKRLSLHFGCFDFVVTPKDEYVFLECNPNGQWGWIEDELNLPMSETLVDCLINQPEINV